ncbi:MAG: hypothetical protein Q8O64_19925 [Sideroxyarcus sp.]|nr:hypothetical protein [Sideroxyarcus sp.]
MHLEDSDDEPVLLGDVLASKEEIAEAAAHARGTPDVKRRLLKAAEFILAKSRQVKRECQPEDILQDAIEAVLVGRRKWPKNRLDFKGLLIGVMRSIVSSRDKTLILAKNNLDVTMEHELHPLGEGQEPLNLEETAADPETTESRILRKEQEGLGESLMVILRAKYGATDIHGLILDKVREGYSSQAEIREALGIADSVYWNAWKALMRAAEKLNSNTKE